MKTSRIVMIVAALAACALWAVAAPAGGPTATLEKVKGLVEVSPAGGDAWQTAGEGQTLKAGDRLRTGAGSEAKLVYPTDPPAVNYVYGDSLITITKLEPADSKGPGAVSLNMLKGGAWTRVLKNKGKTGPNFTVQTPNAVAAVSGTGFATGVTPDGQSFVCACVGQVKVGNEQGQVSVNKCQGTLIKGDLPPSHPLCETAALAAAVALGDKKDPMFGWCLGCHVQGKKPAGYPR